MKTSYMQDLISAGADAMDNMFEVSFLFPDSWGLEEDTSNNLKMRISSFKPPAPKREIINIPFRTISIPKLSSVVSFDRTLSFPIRIDQNYDVYKTLKKVQGLSFSEKGDLYSLDEGTLFQIKVTSLAQNKAGEESPLYVWHFYDVTITSLETSEYSHDSQSSPLSASLGLAYSYYTET